MAEEMPNPQRQMPRSIIGGMLIVMVIYITCNVKPPLFLGHCSPISPRFSRSFAALRLAPKIQETGTKIPKDGPQRSKNGG